MNLSHPPVRFPATSKHPETLLWIGSRRHREFIHPYGVAESMTGQIAHRRNLREAMDRPASHVDHIVIARPDSNRPSESEINELRDQFPTAQLVELTGVCCAAEPPLVRLAPKQLVPWHRASSFLQRWLAPKTIQDESTVRSDRVSANRPAIAVLTASFVDAEGLMQIAEASGAIAVWCRSADALVARNMDVFWWDDSVAGNPTTKQWESLLGLVDHAASDDVTHVWLTGGPNHSQIMAARSAGVDHVLSKPSHVDALVATLGHARDLQNDAAMKAA